MSWIGSVAGVLLGGLLAILGGWVSDHRLTHRERERRQEERKDRLKTRRDDFQRETLLALQVMSQKLLRTTGKMHFLDRQEFQRNGIWQKQQFPEGLSDGHLSQMTETMLLASRVRDELVRSLCEKLRETVAVVGMANDQAHADQLMSEAMTIQGELINRIGQIVRKLDEAEEAAP